MEFKSVNVAPKSTFGCMNSDAFIELAGLYIPMICSISGRYYDKIKEHLNDLSVNSSNSLSAADFKGSSKNEDVPELNLILQAKLKNHDGVVNDSENANFPQDSSMSSRNDKSALISDSLSGSSENLLDIEGNKTHSKKAEKKEITETENPDLAGKEKGTLKDFEIREKLEREAIIAFYNAVLTFDLDQNKVTFGLYAKICVRNRMVSLLRKLTTADKRNRKLSGLASKTVSNKNRFDYLNYIRKNEFPTDNFESSYYKRGKTSRLSDESSAVSEISDTSFSAYEKKVFNLFRMGISSREIAKRFGKSEKSVDNALYRIRVKLKNVYK